MEFFKNKFWDSSVNPKITVVTPFYNRVEYLCRPFDSMKAQTFRDFEYIIINDGSREDADGIVKSFMESVEFPVLYIKKTNGGVHTARNQGVKMSRGELIAFLDADDEFTPNAFDVYCKAWDTIPDKESFREVVANEKDERGFPVNHHRALNRGDIFRSNLFPEPEGVKFVDESIMWRRLSSYKSLFINDYLSIYHRYDISESITQPKGKATIQKCIDNLWNFKYEFENRKNLGYTCRQSLKNLFYFLSFRDILKLKNAYPDYNWAELNGPAEVFLMVILKPLTFVSAIYYIKKRM